MTILTTPLGIVGLLSIFFLMLTLANLSRRLGAVTKMPPYYRGFYVAMGILAAPLVVRLVRSSVRLPSDAGPALLYSPIFYLFAYYLPLAIAVALSSAVAWRYWGWLFKEPPPASERRRT